MSNKLNLKITQVAQQVTYPLTSRRLIYSAIAGGLCLSLSHITHATDTSFLQPTNEDTSLKAELMGAPNTRITPLQKSIKSSFIRNIRAAIAAKWQNNRINDLIAVLNAQTLPVEEYQKITKIPDNSFKPFVGQNLSYDSNLLRLADDGDATKALAGRDKSDFIKQISAGIAAKWSFQRQLLMLNAVVNQTWYSTYHELDYLGRNIQAHWNWQLGNLLTGEIGYENKVVQGNFSQLNSLLNNLQTTNRYYANGEYQFSSGWFLQGGFTHANSRYKSDLLQYNNLDTDASVVGLKYLTQNNNRLGIKATLTDGIFPNREFTTGNVIDDAYTRNDFDFEWAWQYSVKTRVDGTIGYAQQRFKHLHKRDFSAPTANINIAWEISGKTALRLTGWRDIQLANNRDANFILSQGLKLTPMWLPTPKLQITLPMSYENQEYLGDPGFVSKSANAEQDDVSKIGLNVDYSPFDNAKMSFFIQFEDRSSTNLTRNYQSKAIGLDMQLDF
ncbi:MAG: XrtB/PEP-CTERM-associated polysaccharide biosynthesis outer membrane protein EpsL [Methylococcales bacterium]